MFKEYISTKVSKVRWIESEDHLLNESSGLKWFCGTYGQQPNRLSIWTNNQKIDENIQLKSVAEVDVSADVNQINRIDGNNVAISLSNGQILCYDYSEDVFKLRHKWQSLDSDSINDCVFNSQTNELISCGDNGIIRLINIDTSSEKRSKCLTQNSLKAIDLISSKEVICGTSSGHLKLYDIRTESMVLSMANDLSVITCLQRNPNISHVVCCGNDLGRLSIWDLRNSGKDLLQISGHNSYVSQLIYKANEPNVLLSSSFDGLLLRWNISAASQLGSVASISNRDNSPINSFDVNPFDEIIFSADNEVLYLGHL